MTPSLVVWWMPAFQRTRRRAAIDKAALAASQIHATALSRRRRCATAETGAKRL